MPKIIELSGYVGWNITARDLKEQLPDDNSEVIITVDSVGGSVFEGNRLYNALLDYQGKITIILGAIAASAASYFPLAVGAENIKVRENTTFMGHKAWNFAMGNADEMKKVAEMLDGFDRIIAKTYSKVTGKSIEDSLEDMKNEFWLIGGQAVLDAGFASEIIDDEEISSGESEIVDKTIIVAQMEEAKNKLREVENQEDLNKWAAKIDIELNPVNVTPDGQTLLFNEVKNPVTTGKNNDKDGINMGLKTLLDANPEAKAEYTKDVEAAEAKGIENSVKEESKRIVAILNLSGLKIPENILSSITDGDTMEDFAVKEIENRNTALKAEKPADLGTLQNTNQVPKPIEGTETDEDSAAVNKVDAAIDKILGKKKDGK